MIKKYALKNSLGYFFVLGAGFSTSDLKKATGYEYNAAVSQKDNLNATMGIVSTLVEQPQTQSFGVNYVRKTDFDSNGNVLPNAKNPSKRRFKTFNEAWAHGQRAIYRKASAGAAEGSAGHVGFYVTETTDPVNAVVNPLTGLTNSL